MVGSSFLLPNLKLALRLVKPYVWEILRFVKWLVVASLVSLISLNFDRLYLARFVPLAFLGVYRIERSIADLLSTASTYLGKTALFPSSPPNRGLRAPTCISNWHHFVQSFCSWRYSASHLPLPPADLVVQFVYDSRYRDAGWMLSLLILGSWFSVLANVGEWTLVGLGKPSYNLISNGLEFALLAIGLVIGIRTYGSLAGAPSAARSMQFFTPFRSGYAN
jgi:O-antigen/teichoic acid export membrane protein